MNITSKSLLILCILILFIQLAYVQDQLCVELLLIDNQGRRVGYTENGVVNEIPRSYYGEESYADLPIHKVISFTS